PKPSKSNPTPSKTLSSNFPGFSIQSITSPIVLDIHSLPLAAASSDLLTTALLPSTTLAAPALVESQASPNNLSPFFFFLGFLLDKGPYLNQVNPLKIKCVCAPF